MLMRLRQKIGKKEQLVLINSDHVQGVFPAQEGSALSFGLRPDGTDDIIEVRESFEEIERIWRSGEHGHGTR